MYISSLGFGVRTSLKGENEDKFLKNKIEKVQNEINNLENEIDEIKNSLQESTKNQ